MSHHIYIAAALEERDRADRLADRLTAVPGVVIVSDWHVGPPSAVNLRATEHALARIERRKICDHNFARIGRADSLVMLASPTMRGTIAEAAYAHGLHKTVVAVGVPTEHTLMLAFALWLPDEDMVVQWAT